MKTITDTANEIASHACEVALPNDQRFIVIVFDSSGAYQLRVHDVNVNVAIGLLTRAANKLDRLADDADTNGLAIKH